MISIRNQPAWLKSAAVAGNQPASIRLARLLIKTSAQSGTASTLAGVLTGVTMLK